jgi:hypothetical protein
MPTPFLSLPAEIRVKIYRHVASTQHISRLERPRAIVDFRLTCRQIKQEFDFEYLRTAHIYLENVLKCVLVPHIQYRLVEASSFTDRQYLDLVIPLAIFKERICRPGDTVSYLLHVLLSPFIRTIRYRVTGPQPLQHWEAATRMMQRLFHDRLRAERIRHLEHIRAQYTLHKRVGDHAVFREGSDWELHLRYGTKEHGDHIYCNSGCVAVFGWVEKNRSLVLRDLDLQHVPTIDDGVTLFLGGV